MTNLEYYADELKKYIHDYSEGGGGYYKFDDVSGGVRTFIQRHPEIWEGDINAEEAIDWFLAEHKELIKLKQWERDLMRLYPYSQTFNDCSALRGMKNRGYFKGVEDESMTVIEILESCEVVDD